VHLSTGTYGTAAWWLLLLSGVGIAVMLGCGVALTFVEGWLLDRLLGIGLTGALLGVPAAGASSLAPYASAAVPVLSFANFLVVLRLSPLSGYHAAEHKVVAAIEARGDITWDDVLARPRAHPRCGTVLLLGILPAVLIAYPLLWTNPLAALSVAAAGWLLRYHVGYFIQQHFTTKAPTPAQLRAGIEAGRKLLHLWRLSPGRQVTAAVGLWNRGLPQMLGGVIIGQHLLAFVSQHLHLWLDW
jgi:hypothetical protein